AGALPTDQGWTEWTNANATNPGGGPITLTGTTGGGVDYFRMTYQPTPSDRRQRWYYQNPSAASFTDPAGWTLTAVLWVPYSSGWDNVSFLRVQAGQDRWEMQIGRDINDGGVGVWSREGDSYPGSFAKMNSDSFAPAFDPAGR